MLTIKLKVPEPLFWEGIGLTGTRVRLGKVFQGPQAKAMETQGMQRKFVGNRKKAPSRELTEKILSCAREVHSSLGPGLLETTYEEALAHEFSLKGIKFVRQKEVNLSYKGKSIGWHRIDFLVEDEVVVELKCVEKLHGIHQAQLVSYLRSLNRKSGLLINFNVVRFTDGIESFAI